MDPVLITEEQLVELSKKTVDEIMSERLAKQIGSEVANQVKSVAQSLRMERNINGKDISGLSEKAKLDLCRVAKSASQKISPLAFAETKANEALIEQQDNRGGYLVSVELASAILRIAASVGTILNQAQKWEMKTDQLGIPNYTGSYLTGSYVGIDIAGTVQGLTFGQATLIAQKWQLAFAVGNDLLADASVNLADWLLAIAGEALANMIDQQGLVGSSGLTLNGVTVGGPFVGIIGNAAVPVYTLGSGKTKFSCTNDGTPDGFQVLIDGSNAIAQLEESILDGAAFYFHRTTWAAIRTQKDGAGHYILPYSAWAPGTLKDIAGGGPVKPAGEILSYPVYTNRWLPALPTGNAASVSTEMGIFGNMKAMAFGDRGEMRLAQFESGSFGGKEIALADQSGLVYRHRNALVLALPKAFVRLKTASV